MLRWCLWSVLLCWLAGGAPALAATWHVPDERSAAALQTALDGLWPDGDIEVVVGEPGPTDEGVRTVDGEVRLVLNGRVLAAAAASPEESVALVRTWMRDVERGIGWVPKVDVPVPLPEPTPEPDLEPVDPVDEPPAVVDREYYFGINFRESVLQAGPLDGFGLSAQWQLARWGGLGASVTGGQNNPRVSPQDEVLAQANLQSTISSRIDTVTGSLVGHVWVPRVTTGAQPTVTFVAGLEARSTVTRKTIINQSTVADVIFVPGSASLDYGPVLGVGGMVYAPHGVGFIRVAVMDRIRWSQPPAPIDDELVDPRIHEPTLMFEILGGWGQL